jgi:hypothetical protein
LDFSRSLGNTAKVKRRSDGKLLAYRLKDALSASELKDEHFAKPRPTRSKSKMEELDSDPALALLGDL